MKIKAKRFGIKIKRKKLHCIPTIFLSIIIFVFISVVTFKVQMIVRNSIQELVIAGEVEINNLNSAWISSLASYWGCIVGSIISGLLTVIGVFWSIKYYRDSDAVKSRVEHLPFLIARVNIEVHANDIFDPNTQCFNIEHTSSSGEKEVYCFVTLKNIGRSFANTLTVNYGENLGGMEFNRIIQVNDTVNFCFVIN